MTSLLTLKWIPWWFPKFLTSQLYLVPRYFGYFDIKYSDSSSISTIREEFIKSLLCVRHCAKCFTCISQLWEMSEKDEGENSGIVEGRNKVRLNYLPNTWPKFLDTNFEIFVEEINLPLNSSGLCVCYVHHLASSTSFKILIKYLLCVSPRIEWITRHSPHGA